MNNEIDIIEAILSSVEIQSKELQLALLKGEIKWEEEAIQYFLPIVLEFTNFDWLKLIAENCCIKEDEIVIKNFLDMVESIKKVNQIALQESYEKRHGVNK